MRNDGASLDERIEKLQCHFELASDYSR